MKSSILYDRILRSHIIPLNNSNTNFSVNINSPSKSFKGVLFILQKKEAPQNLIEVLKYSLTPR